MKNYLFTPGGWDENDFRYIATAREAYRKPFIQDADMIRNCVDDKPTNEDFISIISKEKYHSGVVMETTCSFEGSGAPLIVLSNEISTLENGNLQYGDHFEVVIYRGGCNIWYIPLVDGKAVSKNVVRMKAPVEENKPVKLRVEMVGKVFRVNADGHEFDVPCEYLPDEYYVGITACEGVCRFYDFSVEQK